MNIEEAKALIRYASSLYPNSIWKQSDDELSFMANVWCSWLGPFSKLDVSRALKAACLESPNRMPTVPQIFLYAKNLSEQSKSEHCELKANDLVQKVDWIESKEGICFINKVREQIGDIF